MPSHIASLFFRKAVNPVPVPGKPSKIWGWHWDHMKRQERILPESMRRCFGFTDRQLSGIMHIWLLKHGGVPDGHSDHMTTCHWDIEDT